MAQAYSKDLRRRVVAFVERANSRPAAARQYGVSPSFAVKLLKLWQKTGSVTPRPAGGRRHAKLARHLDYLIRNVEARPEVTMPELARRLASERGVTVALASLSRVLCQWAAIR